MDAISPNKIQLKALALHKGASQPAYQQIVDQVVSGIESGDFVEGASLPTTRELAVSLRVNRNTVVKAYELLKRRGYLVARIGDGSRVRRPLEAKGSSRQSGEHVISWAHVINEHVSRLKNVPASSQDDETISLGTIQPSDDLLPLASFQESINRVLAKHKAEALSYAPAAGILPLRELAREELLRMGVEVSVDEVIVTHGSSQGLDLVARCFIHPGDKVLVEDPTYHGGIQLLRAQGATLVPIPAVGNRYDLSQLSPRLLDEVKACFVIPNFRNPTATSMPHSERQRLARLVKQHDIIVIEDDYGFAFHFDEDLPPPIKSLSPDNVIYLSSFSKRVLPALRIGYLVAPEGECSEKLKTVKGLVDLGNSALLQYALVDFIQSGGYATHLKQVTSEYRQRRQAMQEALSKYMPDMVSWHFPPGGLFFWLEIPKELCVDRLIHLCAENNLSVAGGNIWSATGRHTPGVRLAFCGEPAARIVQGVEILGRMMKRLLGRRSTDLQPTMV